MSLKYLNYAVTFQEVPDEVSLVINVTNCPHHCDGCHSPELREDTGSPLLEDLPDLIESHADQITCVCFMGEGTDSLNELEQCVEVCKQYGMKTCLYTGSQDAWDEFISLRLDYCKMGPYLKEAGGLNSPTTNQRFYKRVDLADGFVIDDITKSFLKNGE